ncbi:MAG: nuclear transport factor 2 family protein [Chloroflexi bacterium]|uniref:Nuclear transport factor 2 family protein n=1 Tax=Candidatus Chlorohelix allophototropha TaxID=3003348 RepID=A0A8T7M8T4_9CHLR|nr:nuclear transport factor 2 family protein [Chloroflexota bacterium]WJW68347.1 nuclear transport factor 2 family protein [Chloroflexota bacterium L227-S17]
MDIIENATRLLAAFENKDLQTILAAFAEDGILIDPHYPQVEMRGKAAIERGIKWGLGSLEKPGFKILRHWVNGESATFEVATHHIIRGPIKANFSQIFVVESRNGLITRLQSYPNYGPHGISSLPGKVTALVWRLQGKLK